MGVIKCYFVFICVCVETDRAGPPRDSGAVQGREERLRR